MREAKWDTEATCVAFSPTDLSFAVGGKNGDVDVWDLLTGDPLERPPTAPMEVRSLSFAKDGESLTGCGIGSIVNTNRAWRWKVPSGVSIDCWEQGGKNDCPEILNVVLAGGKHIASIAQVLKKASRYPPDTLPPAAGDPLLIAGHLVVAGVQAYQLFKDSIPSDEFRVELWNVKLGTRVRNGLFKGPRPTCLAVSPSGSRLMFGYGNDGKGAGCGLGHQSVTVGCHCRDGVPGFRDRTTEGDHADLHAIKASDRRRKVRIDDARRGRIGPARSGPLDRLQQH